LFESFSKKEKAGIEKRSTLVSHNQSEFCLRMEQFSVFEKTIEKFQKSSKPTWEPDHQVFFCHGCGSEFSFFLRRVQSLFERNKKVGEKLF
jgi:hypothetical protein